MLRWNWHFSKSKLKTKKPRGKKTELVFVVVDDCVIRFLSTQ